MLIEKTFVSHISSRKTPFGDFRHKSPRAGQKIEKKKKGAWRIAPKTKTVPGFQLIFCVMIRAWRDASLLPATGEAERRRKPGHNGGRGLGYKKGKESVESQHMCLISTKDKNWTSCGYR